MRLSGAQPAHAIHVVVVRANAGGAVRLGAPPANSPAPEPASLSAESGVSQRRPRHRARRGRAAGVRVCGVALLVAADYTTGERADLSFVYFYGARGAVV